MPKRSATILMWKREGGALQVLLVHPGGPFWRNKDVGAWSLPKGEYDDSENALAAARRELVEELGPSVGWVSTTPDEAFVPLGAVKQKGGKTWNFTDKTAANADALFVFQRDVEAARKKLAEGYAPVK